MKISARVLSQEVSGELVLLDLATEQYFGLNEVGTEIWRGLEQELGVDEILQRVVERFAVDEQAARMDLERLLSELLGAGLLEGG